MGFALGRSEACHATWNVCRNRLQEKTGATDTPRKRGLLPFTCHSPQVGCHVLYTKLPCTWRQNFSTDTAGWSTVSISTHATSYDASD